MTETTALNFRRPSVSNGHGGVEVARDPDGGGMVLRNGGDPDGPRLIFSADQWRPLIASIALRNWPDAHFAWDPDMEHCSIKVPGDKTELRFTASEMAAFERAVLHGEYALRPVSLRPRPAAEDLPAQQA